MTARRSVADLLTVATVSVARRSVPCLALLCHLFATALRLLDVAAA